MTQNPKGLMIGEYSAFIERIAWYSLGIVDVLADKADGRIADGLGSGTACRWRGHSLILTADHVLKSKESDNLAFLLRVDDAINWEGDRAPEKVVRRISLPIDRILRCKEHDLAAIVLRSSELSRFRIQFCELPNQLMKRRALRRKGALILLGFPYDCVFPIAERETPNLSVHYLAAKPTILHATLAGPPSKPLASSYDPERDVLVKYDPTDPNMKPYGLSGAAAWCDRIRRSGSVWTPEPMLFGVVTHALMTSRLLQIVGASTIREFLERTLE